MRVEFVLRVDMDKGAYAKMDELIQKNVEKTDASPEVVEKINEHHQAILRDAVREILRFEPESVFDIEHYLLESDGGEYEPTREEVIAEIQELVARYPEHAEDFLVNEMSRRGLHCVVHNKFTIGCSLCEEFLKE